MAEEKDVVRVVIEGDLSQESQENIAKQTSESIIKGANNANSTKFNFKNIAQDMLKGVSDATGKTEKIQQRSINAAKSYAAQQDKIKNLVDMQGNGFAKAKAIVGETGKLGIAGIKGMVANMNPYIMAAKAGAEIVKFMADQFQRIAKDSAKFVGQGSIFADKATIDMMQKTGQTATQAQGTQRSLDALGLDFSDIQQGKITAEQAALFEQLRERELKKLEEINNVAGPMFKSMQQVTLGITLLLQDINDWITMAFASADGVESMIGAGKAFLGKIGPFIKTVIASLSPIMSIVGEVVAVVMNLVSALIPIGTQFMKGIQPLLKISSQIFSMFGRVLSPIIMSFGALLEIFMAFNPVLAVITGVLEFVIEILDAVIGAITLFTDFLGDVVSSIGTWVNSLIKILKGINVGGYRPFKNMEYVDVSSLKSGITNSGSTYENQTTNNYIYGSQSMNQANPRQNNNDLFSNSYVLVND